MLTHTIGEDAGRVWTTLEFKGELSLAQLSRELGISEKRIRMAVGWLAREDKLNFRESGKQVFLTLK